MSTDLSRRTHRRSFWRPAWFEARRLWQALVVAAVLVAAAVLGRSPSRIGLMLLLLIGVAPFVISQDVRWLLLTFPAVALVAPLQIGTDTEVSLNAAVLASAGLFVLTVVQRLMRREVHLVPSRLNAPLAAFLLVSILSLLAGNALWAPYVPRPSNVLLVQLGQLAIYILSFCMFWLTANTMTDLKWLRRLVYALVITGGVGLALVLSLRLLGLPGFASGLLLNAFTAWLAPLSLALSLYDSELSRGQRAWAAGVCILTLVAVGVVWFAGGWIGGWLPALVAMALLLWIRYPRVRVPFVILVLVVLVFVHPLRLLEALGIDYQTEWEVSGGARVALWRSVIELTSQRPLLGLGIVAYRYYHYVKPLIYRTTIWMRPGVSAHNMFVDLFAQTGVVGVACYVWFLVRAGLLALKLHGQSAGFAKGYALAAFCAMMGIFFADMMAETSLPFVYNMGFPGFRASVVSWMMLGGLVVLENSSVADRSAQLPAATLVDRSH